MIGFITGMFLVFWAFLKYEGRSGLSIHGFGPSLFLV